MPLADADHVPESAIAPEDAEAQGEAGRVMVQSRPLGSAAAQFAGSAPEKILRVADEPTVVSIWFSLLFRRVTEY